jgi:predicted phosphate transport protein (TIGR00153 family)
MNVFAKSPIKPIEEHIKIVAKASGSLVEFFECVCANNWKQAEEVYQKVADLEREADRLKREIRIELPRGLFLPVERTDLLELLTKQDRIANLAKDIAGRILGRELEVPETIQPNFTKFIALSVEACNRACEAVNEFDALLETGFKGREVELVESMVEGIDRIETDTDKMQISLRSELKQLENGMNPVDVMFLYNIIDWVGGLADAAETVGARLELMLAR